MRNVSRNNTATYLLYLLVQEFCGEYFCTTLNIIASLSISWEFIFQTFSRLLYGDRFLFILGAHACTQARTPAHTHAHARAHARAISGLS